LIKEENEFVERSHNRFLQTARDFVKVCPNCKSIHITTRTRKKPKYKCQYCGSEFDNPKAKIVNKTSKQQRDYGRHYHNPDE
jgi:DNA-directed RNA polymerase subunit M/transcription elongation factor TFIIS